MNYLDKFIEEIKREKHDIYLYGAGCVAAMVEDLLAQNGMSIAGYIVSSSYYPKEEAARIKNGKPIITEEMLLSDAVVVIAMLPCAASSSVAENGHIKKVYRYDIPGAVILNGANLIDEQYLVQNKDKLCKLFDRLEDIESKYTLMRYLTQKLTGCLEKEISAFPAYFDDDIIKPHENEVFVDCGAYNGDTLVSFFTWLRKHGIESCQKYIALEPDKSNFRKLKETAGGYSNVDVHCLGAYESRTVLYFSEDGNENSVISECGTVEIQVDTIDNLTKDEPVTYIKMDIEGAELAALKGASDTIRKYRPRLAICVYHNREDLLRIPDYILSLNSDYKLYLRSYEKFGVDTVLYAV